MDLGYWHTSKRYPHQALFDLLKHLKADIDARNEAYKTWLSLYLNRRVSDLDPAQLGSGSPVSLRDAYAELTSGNPRWTVNTIESCLQTLAARIASQKPKPQFLTTTDGPEAFELQQKAKGLDKFVLGEFMRNRLYQQAPWVFQDGGLTGLGAVKGYLDQGRIRLERTWPGEIIVDERACLTGPPRELMQRKFISGEVLKARFDNRKAAAAIERTRRTETVNVAASRIDVVDLVEVLEAWHLPPSKDRPGRHVIAIDGYTLLDEEYTRPRFPFAFFFWSLPPLGWYPQGLVEQQAPAQKFMHQMLGRLQEHAHLHAVGKTYYEEGSIDPQKIRNQTGDLIPVKKGARQYPKTEMGGSLPADVYRLPWDIQNSIFENTGVSKLSAASVKPAGIESGVALRTLQDTESGRHALLHQRWEQWFVDVARLVVDLARESGADYSTRYYARTLSEEIRFSEVDLDEEAYELQVWPINLLPSTPAGKLETVQQLIEAGMVEGRQALALLDFPDLEQYQSLERAAVDDIDLQIYQMLAKGKEVRPEPFQDLEFGMKRVTSALLRARNQGAPQARLDLLEEWLANAAELLAPTPTTPPPPPAGGPPMPAGPPPGGPAPMPPAPVGPAPLEAMGPPPGEVI